MFESIGYEVLKLKREKIAFLTINDLKSGEYRLLSIKEVKKLYNETKNN
jgi:23S rRNA pseudouridine2605 synthase